MNRLHEIRFFKRVSQHRLAFMAGVHQSRISLIENGLTEPREDEKKRLSKALGVTTKEIWLEQGRGVGNGNQESKGANHSNI